MYLCVDLVASWPLCPIRPAPAVCACCFLTVSLWSPPLLSSLFFKLFYSPSFPVVSVDICCCCAHCRHFIDYFSGWICWFLNFAAFGPRLGSLFNALWYHSYAPLVPLHRLRLLLYFTSPSWLLFRFRFPSFFFCWVFSFLLLFYFIFIRLFLFLT